MAGNRRTLFPLLSVVAIVFFFLGSVTTGFVLAGDNLYAKIAVFTQILNLIERNYVEEVEVNKLVDAAVSGMLESLDPHSVLLTKERFEQMSESFRGQFEGIGIEFTIREGVLTVVAPIEGTPADRAGLRRGDRIIRIDGEPTFGIKQHEVQQKLRGPKDTSVTITIQREGVSESFDVTVVRDTVLDQSVNAAFIIRPGIGYIRLSRFAKTTSDELETALKKLESQGMENLILDLRNNTGGLLDQGVEVTDKFIPGGRVIVYTKGRIQNSSQEFLATDAATHKMYPLIVLINEGSASASEIVSGAVQDWDRALVVGTTSFGKGLVQNQFRLKDDSALLLTTARWYTPLGRLIQKEYPQNRADEYHRWLRERYYGAERDETESDTTEPQKPVFKTPAGRTVYGGGGITPDVVIARPEVPDLVARRLGPPDVFSEFATHYAAFHREQAKDFESYLRTFTVNDEMIRDFKTLVDSKGIKYTEAEFDSSLIDVRTYIKAEIAVGLWNREKGYQVLVESDPQVKAALELFSQAAALVRGKKWN